MMFGGIIHLYFMPQHLKDFIKHPQRLFYQLLARELKPVCLDTSD